MELRESVSQLGTERRNTHGRDRHNPGAAVVHRKQCPEIIPDRVPGGSITVPLVSRSDSEMSRTAWIGAGTPRKTVGNAIHVGGGATPEHKRHRRDVRENRSGFPAADHLTDHPDRNIRGYSSVPGHGTDTDVRGTWGTVAVGGEPSRIREQGRCPSPMSRQPMPGVTPRSEHRFSVRRRANGRRPRLNGGTGPADSGGVR